MSAYDELDSEIYTSAQAILAAGTAVARPAEIGTGLSVFVVPEGYKAEQVDAKLDGPRFAEHPKRKTGTPRFTVADGFEFYVQAHRGDGSLIYADPDAMALVAVLNGHEPDVRPEPAKDGVVDGVVDATVGGAPGWGDHQAMLVLRQTDEWKAWVGCDRKMLDQVAFAEFIEEWIDSVIDPPGATMLEIATSFRANTSVEFKSGRRLQDGQTQLVYNEQTSATAGASGSVTIPERFTIGVQPFDGSPSYKVKARLRYRMAGGKLTLGYLLDQPRVVARNAFDDVCQDVEQASGVHVVFGRP